MKQIKDKLRDFFSKSRSILILFYYLRIGEILFYLDALNWHMKHSIPRDITIIDIYKFFYIDFLGAKKDECRITYIDDNKIVTRCKNDCPILDYSLRINRDTRDVCKRLSEGPCRYFLRKLNKNIVFIRNYNHIRPYEEDCEETILIR